VLGFELSIIVLGSGLTVIVEFIIVALRKGTEVPVIRIYIKHDSCE
jgi:hypothetical protein